MRDCDMIPSVAMSRCCTEHPTCPIILTQPLPGNVPVFWSLEWAVLLEITGTMLLMQGGAVHTHLRI